MHLLLQLHRVFSRIRDHEKKAAQGPAEEEVDPGRNEEPDTMEGMENMEADDIDFPPMPSEEDIERARRESQSEPVESEEEEAPQAISEYKLSRQTLLFSATAIQSVDQQGWSDKVLGWKASRKASARATKLNGTLKGVASNSTLPAHLKQ